MLMHVHACAHARLPARAHTHMRTHALTHTQVIHQLNNATDVLIETRYNTVVGSTYISSAGKIINVNPEKI